MKMTKNKMIRLTITLLSLLSIALIGCGGGGGSGSNPTPALTVLPADYDFGIVTNGNSVATLEATIKNSGTANLVVSHIALSGPEKDNFDLDVNGGTSPCGSGSKVLAPGRKCNVTVDFVPGGLGTFNADLTMKSSDPDAPTYAMNLLGTKEDVTTVNVKINQIEACPRANAKVYVSVTDQGGYPIPGLVKANFTLAEDGGPAAIPVDADFVNNVVTLSVALLMDYSYSITQEPDNARDMQRAATNFINQLGASDEAEIIKYATTVNVTQSFTNNLGLLTTAIATTPNLGGGETALFDALDQAIANISTRGKTRRAIVIITDGKDDDGTGHPLSSATLASVIADANASGVPVFTVGLGNADAGTLQTLANDTGGTYSDSTTSDNLETIYEQLADLLFTNQYILTYNSAIAEDGVATGPLTVTATYAPATVTPTGTDTKTVRACP